MSLFGFTFSRPLYLAVGVALAVVVVAGLWLHARRRRKLADFLGGRRAAGRLARSNLYRMPLERIALLTVGALALSAAAAGPSRPGEPPPPEPPVAEVVLAVDVSMSMQADDAEPNRLGRALQVAEAMLDGLGEHRVGLLLFSGTPYPLAPPTTDHGVVRFMFGGMTPDLMSIYDPGSLPSAAIREAMALLRYDALTTAPGEAGEAGASDTAGDDEAPTVSGDEAPIPTDRKAPRSIVLITDGEAGEPMDELLAAVDEAADAGIAVHTIGVGTAEGGGFPPPVGYRPRSTPSDRWDSIVTTFREETLRSVSGAGGGRYAHADDGPSVEALLDDLGGADLEPEPGREPSPWSDLDPVSILAALAFLALLAESLMDVRLPGIAVARPRRAP